MTAMTLLLQAREAAAELHVDLGDLLVMAVAALLALLIGVVGFLLRRMLKSADEFQVEVRDSIAQMNTELSGQLGDVGEKMESFTREMQTVKHVLFGVDGRNGMRSDLRKTRTLVVQHDRVLERLAARAGVTIERRADDEEGVA